MSISAISRETGYDRKTIRKYLKARSEVSYASRAKKESILEPFKNYLVSRLAEYPLSAVRLFEEIKEQGYPGKYSLVKRFVAPIRNRTKIVAEYRFETKPGIQAQVDWAEIDKIEVDGKRTKLYCFVMVLGYSRMRFVHFTLDCRTETFIECHLKAFEYFGGVTKEILYDNTKNVVLKRALQSSESEWNPLFQDFFQHHGFLPRLCKPGKEGAKTKGKVERQVHYVKDNYYLGLEYGTVPELNNKGFDWLEKVNRKIHGTTHRVPYDLFPEEKLDPINKRTPYQITRTEWRKITRDCHIAYMGNDYSVPWQYAGCQAELRIQNREIAVFVNGKNICNHVSLDGPGHRVHVDEHSEGLLKLKMGKNKEVHEQRIRQLKVSAPEVEQRPLVVYEVYSGGDLND